MLAEFWADMVVDVNELVGRFGAGFSDATRGRLCDADRCLASEKRSSGKSRGWAWWVVCCYGDLGFVPSLDPN